VQIDLGGGLRPVKSLDARLAEVAKLGIKSAVIPKVCHPTCAAICSTSVLCSDGAQLCVCGLSLQLARLGLTLTMLLLYWIQTPKKSYTTLDAFLDRSWGATLNQ